MTQTWWLSFCDSDRPTGQQFLGVVVVDIDETDVLQAAPFATAIRASHGLGPLTDPSDLWMAAAITKTHRLQCNPRGEVASVRIDDRPDFATFGARYPRNRVLSWADIEALEPSEAEIEALGSAPIAGAVDPSEDSNTGTLTTRETSSSSSVKRRIP
jgi:hypothetical protein